MPEAVGGITAPVEAGVASTSVVETIGRYGNSALATIEAPNDAHANAEREDDIVSTSPEITPGD